MQRMGPGVRRDDAGKPQLGSPMIPSRILLAKFFPFPLDGTKSIIPDVPSPKGAYRDARLMEDAFRSGCERARANSPAVPVLHDCYFGRGLVRRRPEPAAGPFFRS